jgi:hypothetical protein
MTFAATNAVSPQGFLGNSTSTQTLVAGIQPNLITDFAGGYGLPVQTGGAPSADLTAPITPSGAMLTAEDENQTIPGVFKPNT